MEILLILLLWEMITLSYILNFLQVTGDNVRAMALCDFTRDNEQEVLQLPYINVTIILSKSNE